MATTQTSRRRSGRGVGLGQKIRAQLLEIAQQAPGIGPAHPDMFQKIGSLSVLTLPDQAARDVSDLTVEQYRGLRERLMGLARILRSTESLSKPEPGRIDDQAAAFMEGLRSAIEMRQQRSGKIVALSAPHEKTLEKFVRPAVDDRPGIRLAALIAVEELIHACDKAMIRSNLRPELFAKIVTISDAIPDMEKESVSALQVLAGIEPRTDARPLSVPENLSIGVIDTDIKKVAAWYATGQGLRPDLETQVRVFERVFTLFSFEHRLADEDESVSWHYADWLAKTVVFEQDLLIFTDELFDSMLADKVKEIRDAIADAPLESSMSTSDPIAHWADEFMNNLDHLSRSLQQLDSLNSWSDVKVAGEAIEKLHQQLELIQDVLGEEVEIHSFEVLKWKAAVEPVAYSFQGLQAQHERLLGSEVAYRTSAFLRVLGTDLQNELRDLDWNFGDLRKPNIPNEDQVYSLEQSKSSGRGR